MRLTRSGSGGVTSHTFRKTAATLLNDGGLTVREVADQLGHQRVSVTQDTYFGRTAASPKVAELSAVIDETRHKAWDAARDINPSLLANRVLNDWTRQHPQRPLHQNHTIARRQDNDLQLP